jgi:glycosyltransferase involved in cell wall biosynthesis
VCLLSLETWDDVWRRNQYLTRELVKQGLCSSIVFVDPPRLGSRPPPTSPMPGVAVVRPRLRLPRSAGGLVEMGHRLRRTVQDAVDVLWVNDAALGVHCLRPGQPVVHDVTDDWREFDFPLRVRRRIIRAEDRLAAEATTVVCSDVLRQRWQDRYAVDAAVIHNGVDVAAWTSASPKTYEGVSPHVGYIGTLQSDRLDVALTLAVASSESVGTLHLVGPDYLDEANRTALGNHSKIRMHGSVAGADVAAWTKGLDVLISPHRVTAFTLSLDAIKSYEYVASGRPVVATPTSGFQLMEYSAVTVVQPSEFVAAVGAATRVVGQSQPRDLEAISWSDRARAFARQLMSSPTDA